MPWAFWSTVLRSAWVGWIPKIIHSQWGLIDTDEYLHATINYLSGLFKDTFLAISSDLSSKVWTYKMISCAKNHVIFFLLKWISDTWFKSLLKPSKSFTLKADLCFSPTPSLPFMLVCSCKRCSVIKPPTTRWQCTFFSAVLWLAVLPLVYFRYVVQIEQWSKQNIFDVSPRLENGEEQVAVGNFLTSCQLGCGLFKLRWIGDSRDKTDVAINAKGSCGLISEETN